jgi:outer membrane protein assembly factor BamB
MCLRVSGGKTTKLWHHSTKGCYVSSPVYHKGHLYWSHDGRIAYCMDATTGKEIYKERFDPDSGDIYAAPVLAGGRIYYASRENGVYVVPAQAEYRLLAHNKIETDNSVFQGSPAVAGGRLYLRSDRYLYCIGN